MQTKYTVSSNIGSDRLLPYKQLKKRIEDFFHSEEYCIEDLVRELELHPMAARDFILSGLEKHTTY